MIFLIVSNFMITLLAWLWEISKIKVRVRACVRVCVYVRVRVAFF